MPVEIAVTGLRAGYGPLEVLHGVDLDFPRARVTGLLGPNGAGKTTLLRTLAGQLPARAGRIRWRGERIDNLPPEQRAARGLVAVPADGGVFPSLTVQDNLEIFAAGRPLDPALTTFPALAGRRRQRAGTLSGGEQRMLALSRAVLATPVVLLVDEPTLGLSPSLADQLYRVLAAVASAGVTVVLADQSTERVLSLAAVAYRLEHGEIAFAGDAGELTAAP
jgi:branched-chain amino acid transport system ATP-binding protein